MPTHKYKNVPSKPDHEIQDLVDAIKAVKIGNSGQRAAATTFKINRRTLQRYLSKIEEAELDVSNATNDKLFAFVSELCEKTGGKTVRNSSYIC